jgi:hypothetical protein
MSPCRRPCLLAVLTTGVLAVSGCGGSSKKASTQSSSTSPSTASTGTSTTRPSTSSLVASASAGSGNAVSASAGGVTASMHGSTHAPKVERPWPIHFTVTRGGHAVKASVSYEYLFGGQVVAHRSHYTFDGHFSDVFKWPSSAVGYPLTFRAVIVSEGVTINLEYPVQVST